jgi:hypothetical protein
MIKMTKLWMITLMLSLGFVANDSFAQFGGRGGIFGGMPRSGRSDRGSVPQDGQSRASRPVPLDENSYEQIEHRLLLLQAELRLTAEQQRPWQSFADKVLAYASDLAHERARLGVPVSSGAPIGGLQHIDDATDIARHRLNELEEIRVAANALYAALSSDQKKIADLRIITIVAPSPSAPSTADSGSNFSDRDFSPSRSQR